MRILVVGGGSGGHVTPVAAVCRELRRTVPGIEIRLWCDRKFSPQAKLTIGEVDPSIRVEVISAGKLRRYHGLPLWKQLLQVRTIVLPNLIDGGRLVVGFAQSFVRLRRYRPDVVFTKGGFVCLPVGLAAKLLSIPLVIHDSDAHPGLTNRILSRYAARIATGAPLKYYPYPAERSVYVGIPVVAELKPVSKRRQASLKERLGYDPHEPLVVVTGGGLGAKRLNDAVMKVSNDLLAFTYVALVAGKTNDADFPASKTRTGRRMKVYGYLPSKEMVDLMAAADIVVTRAGATTLLELAALAKPSLIVPNDLLTGGHQTKNALVYEKAGAAVVVKETELESAPLRLVDALNSILLNKRQQDSLAKAIGVMAMPNAARDTAQLIVEAASTTIERQRRP